MNRIILATGLLLALPATSFAMGENLEGPVPGYDVPTSRMQVQSDESDRRSITFNEDNELNPDWGGPK